MSIFQLQCSNKGLSLHWQQLSISVDFTSPQWQYRHRQRQHEHLAKAMGITQQQPASVIDATAGLGRDAFILASLGCQVLLLERSPLLVELLADGLKRAYQQPNLAPIIERMTLKEADSTTFLQTLAPGDYPDHIYLDPMFPARQKSALVKKDMQILQALLGHDNDTQSLLESALVCAKQRIVIKRPKLAPALTNIKTDFTINGKSSRFDVYLRHGKPS